MSRSQSRRVSWTALPGPASQRTTPWAWADVTPYFLTNNISGAWIGSYFANTASWEKVPEHLKTLFKLCIDSSHYYRQHWYWAGEADLRVNGPKMKLTTIPAAEVEERGGRGARILGRIAATSPRAAKVVQISGTTTP